MRACRILLLLWLVSLAGCATTAVNSGAAPAPPYRIVGYVAGWSLPAVIHAEKLTHINFAFARIDARGEVAFADPQLESALATVLQLRRQNPALRVIVSVGGWEADGFSDAALTEASRDAFARSAVEFLRRHALDGIDIDWEYPGQGIAGIRYRAEDRGNFTLLLQALRARLDAASVADGRRGPDRYTLTIATADREYFDYTEMDRVHGLVDWINVMAYDFFNSLTPTTGHHAGLYASESAAPTDRNADASIRQHLAAGIPPDKLVLGVAFYGRGFAGVTAANHGLNQPYERYEGDHSYAELADRFIGRQGFVRDWDNVARAPSLWNEETRVFISYDDPRSIRTKAAYVRAMGLGGMMFWELGQDRNDELLDVIVAALNKGDASL